MSTKLKLTNTTCLGLLPGPGKAQTIYWDIELKGFGVRVSPQGKAVFFVQYRDKVGKQAKHTIGQVGVVKADAARSKAIAALSEVHLGGNPQEALTGRRASARVIDLVDAYLDQARAGLKARSFLEVERSLRKAAKPLHQDKADSVTRGDVAALLDKIARTSGPYAANRTRAYLSSMWTWALKDGRVEAGNPVTFTNTAIKETPRDRVLSDAELGLIWRCTDTGHDHDRIVRLLMLTAKRRDEVGAMSWGEMGETSPSGTKLWTMSGRRTKNGLAHEVPLGGLACDQLPAPRADRPVAFGRETAGARGFSGWSKCKARLDRRMLAALRKDFAKEHGPGLGAGEAELTPWRLHDLRRTFSTWANESGVEPHVVEAVLNHISGSARRGVAGTYNKAQYRAQKRAALARWEAHIREVCDLPALRGE